jgi:Holliday junction DNA helicase RuvB
MTEECLLNNHEQKEDLKDKKLRPLSLQDFIGQNHLKENLSVFIKAALNRKDTLDHVLFHGPPGLGKTTLAQIVSQEMKVGFKSTSGPILVKAGDLAALLTNLDEGDVLFIDEIHRLNSTIEEVLYPAMEDFKLDLIIGEGPAARIVKIDLPRFTLVGATTRLGLITNPLRDRFGIPLRLNFYNSQELMQVITRGARIINATITPGGATIIAARARGTPRIALRLLKRVRDFACLSHSNIIDEALASDSLSKLEVDAIGLDSNDHRYLQFIINHYQGGPVGLETIAAGLSEQRDSIEETIEPYLIQIGLVQRTMRGRVLTPLAFTHLNLSLPRNYAKESLSLFGDETRDI